jgi:hypothetical protein
MNLDEIKSVYEHLLKTCKCPECDSKYKEKNIELIATTKTEGLLDMECPKCKLGVWVTVVSGTKLNIELNREHGGISKNDILDIKNSLNRFDGDFKKIFNK